MTSLKRSFFWAAFYLAVILVLGETDYTGRPIINFASYFYLVVMIAIPVTLFFPSVSKVSVYVPLLVWAGIYMVVLQTIDRSKSATEIEYSIIILEFILLEVGVWFVHQLAVQVSYAESVMDALALGAFPNRAQDIELESQSIKIELTRSRRYNRPLSLIVIEIPPDDHKSTREVIKSIQNDLLKRFTFARIGQTIDDRVRQTDLVLRDRRGRFIVLCPETDFDNVTLLAGRIAKAVEEKTDMRVLYGVAAFPVDALTFDDLLQKARQRLIAATSIPGEHITQLATYKNEDSKL